MWRTLIVAGFLAQKYDKTSLNTEPDLILIVTYDYIFDEPQWPNG